VIIIFATGEVLSTPNADNPPATLIFKSCPAPSVPTIYKSQKISLKAEFNFKQTHAPLYG